MRETEEVSLLEYIKILLQRKWIILLVLLIVLLAVFILNTITLPVYKATTTLLISPSTAQQSIFGGSRLDPVFGGSDEIETQIAILKSYSIAQGVAEKLPAGIFEQVRTEAVQQRQENLRWPFNPLYRLYLKMKSTDTTAPTLRDTAEQIQDSLTVSSVRDTSMIEISCENNDPELAAEIANTTVAVFMEKSLIINRSNASEATKFIAAQLLEKERELTAQEEELQEARSLENGPEAELRLARLERTVRVSEDTYLLLLEKYQEARINEVMEFRDIRIIDEALPSDESIKPRTMLNLAIGGILGLMLGIFLAFFLEYLDNTIKNSEDAERMLGLPVLGVIPRDSTRKMKERNKSKDVI